MEAKELHTISTTPLVSSPFAVEWSEDDRISLVTEKHLHITVSETKLKLRSKVSLHFPFLSIFSYRNVLFLVFCFRPEHFAICRA